MDNLKGGRIMKKVIDEMKKHKKIMIGIAVIVVIGVHKWIYSKTGCQHVSRKERRGMARH